MLVLIFAVAVAVVVAALQLKQYRAFLQLLQDHTPAGGAAPQHTPLPMARRAALLVPVLICAGAAVYILAVPGAVPERDAYLALLAVLAIIFLSSFATCRMMLCLYYTDEGFFTRERFIPFKELKKLNHGGRKPDTVELRDGTVYQLPRTQMQALEQLKAQKVFRLGGKKGR